MMIDDHKCQQSLDKKRFIYNECDEHDNHSIQANNKIFSKNEKIKFNHVSWDRSLENIVNLVCQMTSTENKRN